MTYLMNILRILVAAFRTPRGMAVLTYLVFAMTNAAVMAPHTTPITATQPVTLDNPAISEQAIASYMQAVEKYAPWLIMLIPRSKKLQTATCLG